MNDSLLFSICIPSYNRPQEIQRLLDSIDYSYSEKFEIVICEDSSPRRSEIRETVQNFIKKSAYSVRYIENDYNLGYDRNLRTLINYAKGTFIIFMGDDDMFIPRQLDDYAKFIERNLNCGYILRSYRNIYLNHTVENFQYFNANKYFEPSKETYILMFDKSVFISGFTIKKENAKEFETNEFDGSLLYQLYLLSEVCRKYPSAYYYQPITQAIEGGTPFFGSSENEKGLYTPGTITVQNSINFMKWYMYMIDYIAKKYDDDSADLIKLNMSKYSYPTLAIQREKGRKVFYKYTKELYVIGLGTSVYFYIYSISLYLFGVKFCNNIIRFLKKMIGHRPKL